MLSKEQVFHESVALNFIEHDLLKSSDPEKVFIGLYFLYGQLELIDTFFEKQINLLLEDERELVKTQIMWLVSQCVQYGLFVDAACRFVKQESKSSNPIMRMWAFEIVQALCQVGKVTKNDTLHNLAACYKEEKNPLVQAQLLCVMDYLGGTYHHQENIMLHLHAALTSLDDNLHHEALYLLTKMKRYNNHAQFVAQELLIGLRGSYFTRMQSLWVLSNFIDSGVLSNQIYQIAHAAFVDQDWHVRLGGAILLKALYTHEQPFDVDKVIALLDICKKDESIFLQIYGDVA